MPIYEYRCTSCDRKSSFFTRSVRAEVDAVCSHCGSRDMQRVISTVSFRIAGGGSSGIGGHNDLSDIGRYAENAFEQTGMDMPESVRKTINEARGGKLPEDLDI